MSDQTLAAAHLAATAFMAGLIWFVQVVHYPLFAAVGREAFAAYERKHTALTTLVVGPAMLAEAVLAGFVLLRAIGAPGDDAALATVGTTLLAVAWFSTAFLQVPCHRRLERGFDAGVARHLVSTNWVRTAAWSGRVVVAVLLIRAT